MNKILYFILLFLAIIGFLGGIGYAIYSGAYIVAIGVITLGFMAYPRAKEYFNKLIS